MPQMYIRKSLFSLFFVLSVALFTAFTAAAQVPKTPAESGATLSVCKMVDDDWKCVGQSNQWAANQPFNVYFFTPTPVGIDTIGIVIHKQGADGKDTDFINEYEAQMGAQNRKYATEGTDLKLPAGTYSIYIISWGDRENLFHKGNFKKYFAKTTLVVK